MFRISHKSDQCMFTVIKYYCSTDPAICLTLGNHWNGIVRGAQPKMWYCGHVKSRLMHIMSRQGQKDGVPSYMVGKEHREGGYTMGLHGSYPWSALAFAMTVLPGFMVPLIGLVGYWLVVSKYPSSPWCGRSISLGPAAKWEVGVYPMRDRLP